jgi:acyl-CoA reductase-like NAD-dependent aldehyde dehydrogenase
VNALAPVPLNDRTLQAGLSRFPRDRAMWIDGEDVESGGGATFDRLSPAHGALVTRAPRGTAADADRAIAAARKAFDAGPWPKMVAAERSGVLLGTADLIDRDRDLLAHLDSLESGKPISQAFTGSTVVGRASMAAASATLKKVSMELGGKNPQIIFADADMEAVIDACVFGAYFNAGECCNAGARILLQRDIAGDFIAGLAEKSKAVRVGDPLDPETKVGAIISADHLAKIERHAAAARDAGATLRAGRQPDDL